MPAQRQIHGAGVLVPPAARVLGVFDEQLYIATLGVFSRHIQSYLFYFFIGN